MIYKVLSLFHYMLEFFPPFSFDLEYNPISKRKALFYPHSSMMVKWLGLP